MPNGLSPASAQRSARVAKAVRTEMARQGIRGPELRARIEALTGQPLPNDMWLSRRLTGRTSLVRPVQVIYGPTDDLELIAKALKVDPTRLVRVVNVGESKAKPKAAPHPVGDTRCGGDSDHPPHPRGAAPGCSACRASGEVAAS